MYIIEVERHGCIPRMKQGFMLNLLKEPLGFSADCLHMLHASHMKAAGRKQGGSCSQRSFLHAASVFGALGFAFVRPNSYSIKTLSVFHINCLNITCHSVNDKKKAFNLNEFVLIHL